MSLSLWAQALPVLIEFAPALFGIGAAGSAIGTGLQVANAVNSLLSGGDISKQSTVDTIVDYGVDTANQALGRFRDAALRRTGEILREAYRSRLRPRPQRWDKPRPPRKGRIRQQKVLPWIPKEKYYRSRGQPF
ncbi:hypothetical protein GNI_225950 [Gregarina niphandrodes]|uniref:Uncharacterized protein n=1 Tax=Gregarina niphandrodes TaxID=110365 RepID=A0A023AVZ1_GRENI|nr:hypothetical protein GNI_225950 [Gregarina niphandrodes]EZG42787.1 hypothetical protein GNI_225950 [Gregarina niphandrodes]|eukprot:XP_011133934.1 hypothetical protein GNI_225950 [Gregarina niphandrodes]